MDEQWQDAAAPWPASGGRRGRAVQM